MSNMPVKHAGLVVDAPLGQTHIVHCPAKSQYYRLGLREAALLESLDGTRSNNELAVTHGFTSEQVSFLLQWFHEKGLLESSVEAPTVIKKWYQQVTTVIADSGKWRIKLVDPDAFLDRNKFAVDALFSRWAWAFYLTALLMPLGITIASPRLVMEAFQQFRFPSGWHEWMGLYAMLLAMNIVHEFAHAATCKHFGGKVPKIGIMFMYLQPVMYCDVTDSWRFRKVNEKIAVAVAGILAQFVIAGVTFTAWILSGNSLLLYFTAANIFIALFNLFPLVKLDGYWMLVHLLDEPNLRMRGREAVDLLLRKLVRRDKSGYNLLPRRLLAFGLGQLVAIPAFWLMGLHAIGRLLSRVSEPMAWGVVTLFAAPLVYRTLKGGITYLQTFKVTGHQGSAV